MNKHAFSIEQLPFFESPYKEGKAIVDISLLEKWIEESGEFELLAAGDEKDRTHAYRELSKGESLDLPEAMREW